MGGKSVRLLDPRASKPGVSSTNSRATEGVTVDPSSDFRLAAHVDNQIQIWDIRNFDKPVVSLEQERAVTRISWCPTRPGLLASTARDCGTVLLHDIMSWPPGNMSSYVVFSDCTTFQLIQSTDQTVTFPILSKPNSALKMLISLRTSFKSSILRMLMVDFYNLNIYHQ